MRLASAIKYDIKLQFRHGFYYVYLLIALIYIVLLRSLPEIILHKAATFVIFTDPSVLGFFFLGGIILLEKRQQILEGLFVTPFTASEYIISKVVSLTLLSVLVCYIIMFFTFGFSLNYFLFSVGIILSSVFFILIGFTLSVITKSINHYVIYSPAYLIIFMLPVLDLFNIWSSPLFYLLPSKASLLLMHSVFEQITFGEVLYSIVTLLIWIAIAWIWAYKWFCKYVLSKK